jgi:hypothetical protein
MYIRWSTRTRETRMSWHLATIWWRTMSRKESCALGSSYEISLKIEWVKSWRAWRTDPRSDSLNVFKSRAESNCQY